MAAPLLSTNSVHPERCVPRLAQAAEDPPCLRAAQGRVIGPLGRRVRGAPNRPGPSDLQPSVPPWQRQPAARHPGTLRAPWPLPRSNVAGAGPARTEQGAARALGTPAG